MNPVIGDIKKFYWSLIKANDIRWNFEKFLITPDGLPYRRYETCSHKMPILLVSGLCLAKHVEKGIVALLVIKFRY